MGDLPERSIPPPWVGLVLVWALLCGLKLVVATPDVWKGDASGYYAWGQSLVVDGDLDPTNQLADEPLPTLDVGGRRVVVDKYPVGWSVAALPGLALGQALARSEDGLAPLVVRLAWTSVFAWTLLGLWMSFCFVRAFTDARAAAWGCAAAWLGTSAFAYTWKEPMMAHGLGLAFIAASCELTRRWSAEPRAGTALLAGLATGMVAIVRPANALLLLPLAPLARAVPRPRVSHVVAAVAGVALAVAVQAGVWKAVYGVWVFGGYGLVGEAFGFAPANVPRVLASSQHGLLFWHPALIAAFLGLGGLARSGASPPGPRVARAGLLGIGALVVLYASWHSWSLGWSHGARWATDAYVLWALGIAHWLAARSSHPGWPRALLAGACLWSALLIGLQLLGRLPMAGPLRIAGFALP